MDKNIGDSDKKNDTKEIRKVSPKEQNNNRNDNSEEKQNISNNKSTDAKNSKKTSAKETTKDSSKDLTERNIDKTKTKKIISDKSSVKKTDDVIADKSKLTKKIDESFVGKISGFVGDSNLINKLLKGHGEKTSTTSKPSTSGQTKIKEGTESTTDTQNKKDVKQKKKKPNRRSFLNKAIKVGDSEKLNNKVVIDQLLINIKNEEVSWNTFWKRLKKMNLAILVIVLLINLIQVLIQLVVVNEETLKILATCLPVISSLFITFQNRFSLNDKAEVSKTSLEFYRKMLKHVETRIRLEEVGGKVTDVINLWNASLVSEMNEIPQALFYF